MENKIDINEKISELQKAFSDLKKNISETTKNLQINVSDWTLTINSKEDEIAVDFSLKIIVKHNQKDDLTKDE